MLLPIPYQDPIDQGPLITEAGGSRNPRQDSCALSATVFLSFSLRARWKALMRAIRSYTMGGWTGAPGSRPFLGIFRLVTSVLRALTWASPYSEGDSRRSSCALRPTQFAHFTFPSSGTVFRAHPLSP